MATYLELQTIFNKNAVSTVYKFEINFIKDDNDKEGLFKDINPTISSNTSGILLAQSTTLPTKTIQPVSTKITGGYQIKRDGLVQITQEISVTLLELNEFPIQQFIKNFSQFKVGEKDNAKKRFITLITRPMKEKKMIYRLEKCFIQNYTLPPLDGGSNTPEMITLTIGFEDFDFDFK